MVIQLLSTRSRPGDMTSDKARLVSELRAIEAWDDDYYRHDAHDRGDIVAFESRQIRRREILEQLIREMGWTLTA